MLDWMIWGHNFHHLKLLFSYHIYKFQKELTCLLLALVSHSIGICILGLWLELKSFSSTVDSKCQQFKVAWLWFPKLPYCWMLQTGRKKKKNCLLPWETCVISVWFSLDVRSVSANFIHYNWESLNILISNSDINYICFISVLKF